MYVFMYVYVLCMYYNYTYIILYTIMSQMYIYV